MAWEWSHTAEAYANAYANVQCLPHETLLEILGEWQYHDQDRARSAYDETKDNDPDYDPLDDDDRPPAPSFDLAPSVADLPADLLADAVWARMEDLRTYTNGGHRAYCCPDGCHTVSFDPPAGEETSDHA